MLEKLKNPKVIAGLLVVVLGLVFGVSPMFEEVVRGICADLPAAEQGPAPTMELK